MDHNDNQVHIYEANSNSTVSPSLNQNSKAIFGDHLPLHRPCTFTNPCCLPINIQTSNWALLGVDAFFKTLALGVLFYILTILCDVYGEVEASENQPLDKQKVLELIVMHIILLTAYALTVLLNIPFYFNQTPSWILFMLIYRILQGKITIVICIIVILKTEHNLLPVPIKSHRQVRIAQHVSMILSVSLISIVLLEYYIAWNHVAYLLYVRSDDFKNCQTRNRIDERKRKVLSRESKRNNRVYPEETLSDFKFQENPDEPIHKPQKFPNLLLNPNNRVYPEELLVKAEKLFEKTIIPIPELSPPSPGPPPPPLLPQELHSIDNLNRPPEEDKPKKKGRRSMND